MQRFILYIAPVWLLAAACGSSQEPIPALQDRLNCWVDDADRDLLVDAGVAYLLDETGARYQDGDRKLLAVGFQGAFHMDVSAEVVGDLSLTNETKELAPRTRFFLRDDSGELVASTSCADRYPYGPGGEEGLVIDGSSYLMVSPAYYDRLVGHSATLSVRTLDAYGHLASGEVELVIYGSEDE